MSLGRSDERPLPVERRVDLMVRGATLVMASAAGAALLIAIYPNASGLSFAAAAIYVVTLWAMTVCSALYGLARNRPRHDLFRRLDQAAIFLLIAGTYTPLVVAYGSGGAHARLLGAVWIVASAGALLMLAGPRRLEKLSLPLYLLLGWATLSDPALLVGMPLQTVVPLVAGGLFYTVGVIFHRSRIRFQEAIWHGFVMAGAACHYAAIVSATK